jgi:hypothetical protein
MGFGGIALLFLTLALVGGNSKLHTQATLPPEREPLGTHWIEGWVVPSPGLDMWRREKCLSSVRNQTPALQPLACHYTGSVKDVIIV